MITKLLNERLFNMIKNPFIIVSSIVILIIIVTIILVRKEIKNDI